MLQHHHPFKHVHPYLDHIGVEIQGPSKVLVEALQLARVAGLRHGNDSLQANIVPPHRLGDNFEIGTDAMLNLSDRWSHPINPSTFIESTHLGQVIVFKFDRRSDGPEDFLDRLHEFRTDSITRDACYLDLAIAVGGETSDLVGGGNGGSHSGLLGRGHGHQATGTCLKHGFQRHLRGRNLCQGTVFRPSSSQLLRQGFHSEMEAASAVTQ